MIETVNCFGTDWLVHHRWGRVHPEPTPRANCWYDSSAIEILPNGTVNLRIHRNPAVIDNTQKVVTDTWVRDGEYIPELDKYLKQYPGSLYKADYGTGLLCSVKNYGFGKYTLKAILPKANFLWPAFWLHTDKENSSEEIDNFEAYSKDNGYKAYKKRLFCKPKFIGWDIQTCLHANVKLPNTGVKRPDLEEFNLDPSLNVITYELYWTPGIMSFKINGYPFRYIMDLKVLDYFAKFNGTMMVIINNHVDGRYYKNFTTEGISASDLVFQLLEYKYEPF